MTQHLPARITRNITALGLTLLGLACGDEETDKSSGGVDAGTGDGSVGASGGQAGSGGGMATAGSAGMGGAAGSSHESGSWAVTRVLWRA